MIITVEANQTIFDLAMMQKGNLDNFVKLMIDLKIEKIDENLSSKTFDLNLDTSNFQVMKWFKNGRKICIGEDLSLVEINGDFNEDYNEDYNNQKNNL